MSRLHQIQDAVHLRSHEITSVAEMWPCRKGCDDCCRSLASPPRVSCQEWEAIAAELDRLPADVAETARRRIREPASQASVCPLLDCDSGACLVYDVRPVACRAYGFYAERQYVLGCHRIEAIGYELPDLIWGNHVALQDALDSLGPAQEFAAWLASEDPRTR